MPTSPERTTDVMLRVRGIVQGVGYRPFVFRTATQFGLRGWVRNDGQGVLVRVAGPDDRVTEFARALREAAPAAAAVSSVETHAPQADAHPLQEGFLIEASSNGGAVEVAVPPDLALCPECRRELNDPADRRHAYPFINCTQCGPRYSLIVELPYDRPATTMRCFRMCPSCQAEYDAPLNRRFHAQPNACPACGPHVTLRSPTGSLLAEKEDAVAVAARHLARGEIVAVKGIGGYHLLVDATNPAAVAQLRRRKHRDEKPFAVMFSDLTALATAALISDAAAEALVSPAAPIVLVPARSPRSLAPDVAPGNPWIGAMLAYSPLHLLLLQRFGRPVVATSGNLAEEPLCTDPSEAHDRLGGIAEVFLDHDRPIAHPVDDSVLRLAASGPILLRRARGYAPAPLSLPARLHGHWLCVGGQMKNTVAVAQGDRLVLSPHIGDLGGAATLDVFRRTTEMLATLHHSSFTGVACDKHPDYGSTRHAATLDLPCVAVQHHLAHILACLLEHEHPADDVLGVAWDGTGYGEDGTIWGGEFIRFEHNQAERFARLRPFRLAGGDAAVRDPRRVALGLLNGMADPRFMSVAHELGLSTDDALVLRIMLSRGLNAPVTSSVGRLFDAVGALLHLGRHNHFEAQTALAVEVAAAEAARHAAPLPLHLRELSSASGARYELDWQPLLEAILTRRSNSADIPQLAASFHHTLAQGILQVARHSGVSTVALSGGCFQNTLLLDLTVDCLRQAGFAVLTHRALPPHDGNLAAGQALGVLRGLTSVALP